MADKGGMGSAVSQVVYLPLAVDTRILGAWALELVEE